MSAAADEALQLSHYRRRLPPPRTRRAVRMRARLSQAAVARVCGVTHATVSRWEGEGRTPSDPRVLIAYVDLLERLAEQQRPAKEEQPTS